MVLPFKLTVSQQYHLSCRNEFKIGPSDFEIFDQGKVDTFSKEVSLSRRISIQETFFMMFLMVGSFYLLATDFILSLCFFLLFIILLFRSAYNWGKIDEESFFVSYLNRIGKQIGSINIISTTSINGLVWWID